MGKVIDLDERAGRTGPRRARLTKTVIDRLQWDPDGGAWQVCYDEDVQNLCVRLGARSKRWVPELP